MCSLSHLGKGFLFELSHLLVNLGYRNFTILLYSPTSIIMVCDSVCPVCPSIQNHLFCCSQWTYGHDFWYMGGCEASLSMYITYNSVSTPTPWAVAGPMGSWRVLYFISSLKLSQREENRNGQIVEEIVFWKSLCNNVVQSCLGNLSNVSCSYK